MVQQSSCLVMSVWVHRFQTIQDYVNTTCLIFGLAAVPSLRFCSTLNSHLRSSDDSHLDILITFDFTAKCGRMPEWSQK